MKYVLLLVSSIVVISCSDLKTESTTVVYYYDMDSLLEAQKTHVLQKKATLRKWASVDSDTSQSTYEPDSLGWKDELAFFKKMNINKPVLQGIYETSIDEDDKSNLTVKEFVADNEADVEVQYLRLYFLDSLQNLKKVEALYNENNPIYKSSRQFILTFDDINGAATLTSFLVEGGQKMIFKDSVTFKIKGELSYP